MKRKVLFTRIVVVANDSCLVMSNTFFFCFCILLFIYFSFAIDVCCRLSNANDKRWGFWCEREFSDWEGDERKKCTTCVATFVKVTQKSYQSYTSSMCFLKTWRARSVIFVVYHALRSNKFSSLFTLLHTTSDRSL